jgi:hypothetical protein
MQRFRASSESVALQPPNLLVMWAGLHVIDALLTLSLLGLGGIEGNPLLATVQSTLGDVSMLGAKVVVALAAGLAVVRAGKGSILGLGNTLMAGVVLYNAALVFWVMAP